MLANLELNLDEVLHDSLHPALDALTAIDDNSKAISFYMLPKTTIGYADGQQMVFVQIGH